MVAIIGIVCVVGIVPAIMLFATLLDNPPVENSKPDPHLFWIRDGKLSRNRRIDDAPVRILPKTELGIRQPFTPVPKRFTVCFNQTEFVGEKTYRDPPPIERVRLEDAQALADFLYRLRLIETLYGTSDKCYLD